MTMGMAVVTTSQGLFCKYHKKNVPAAKITGTFPVCMQKG